MQRGLFNIGPFRLWRARSRIEQTPSGTREQDLLASCLAELDERGWDVEEFLRSHAELSDSLRMALRAAARVRRAPRPLASAQFRARARARFAERVSADVARSLPRRRSFVSSLGLALRPIAVPVTVALVLVFGIGGIGTAAASALPGTPLYPAKLAAERVQLLVAYTPEQQAEAHLNIAAARLQEAAAVDRSGNSAEVPALLHSFEEQVAAAEAAATKVQSPQYHEKVTRTIETLQDRQRKIPPVVAASNKGRGARADANEPSNAQPTAEASRKADHVVGAPVAKPDEGHLNKKDDDGTPVPPTATAEPTSTPAPAQSAPVRSDQPSEQLLKTLIAQAIAGDVSGAATTSRAYVLAIRSDASSDGAVNKLQGQLAQLQQAIGRAPASTRQSLQDAIDAIDTFLADAPGFDHQSNAKGKGSSNENGSAAANPSGSSDDRHGNSGGNGDNGSSTGHGNGGDGNGKKH